MNRFFVACVAGLALGTAASGEIITFDEVPLQSSLDGMTVDGALFSYHPNGSALDDPIVLETTAYVSGVAEGATLRGAGVSDDYVVRMDFPGTLDGFGLSLTTQPFSGTAPIAADVRFLNAAGDVRLEFPAMSETVWDGAVLPDGTVVFKFGRSDTSMVMNDVYDVVAAEIRIVTTGAGNNSAWYMDNLTYSLVPAPATLGLLIVPALVRRRR